MYYIKKMISYLQSQFACNVYYKYYLLSIIRNLVWLLLKIVTNPKINLEFLQNRNTLCNASAIFLVLSGIVCHFTIIMLVNAINYYYSLWSQLDISIV